MLCQSLPPVVSGNVKVLILGSMPGAVSIQQQQYYAHPRNQFWKILYSILSLPVPSAYSERVNGILEKGIGLWDVLYSCQREGSSDNSIRYEIPNDFSGLWDRCPQLKLIAFNGTTARKMSRKHVLIDPACSAKLITLPSSSPALAKPLEYKIKIWSVITEYLAD